ncbi:MAG: class I SAM-dependent methyltransferase, partial [Anaerolineaceae bacterium]|nr:class I SAM-dependent methyltransferase [Anaerolineaceae bacterium]
MQDQFFDLQESYDRVAEEYASRLYKEMEKKPLDRQLLDRFADDVKDLGPVCDMGCGPGQIARYLSYHDVDDVFGIDLSPEMVALARRLNPDIAFRQGNILSLEKEDNSWGGVAAFYSIIHIPRGQVVNALRELKRVLKPGGLLLLSF